jgi:hypothetical protein
LRDEDEDEVESIGDGEDAAAAFVALLGSILELLLGVFIDSTAAASAVVPPAVLVLTEGVEEVDWAEPEKKLLALLMATYIYIRVDKDKISEISH